MSDREPIDSLQIDIESSSADASKSLDALVSSLKKLDRIGKSNSFLLVKKRLQGIASVRFDDLDKQLRSITKNVKSLETVQKALKNLKITTPKIDTASVSNSVNKITEELERVAQPVIASGEVFGGNKEPEKPVWLEDLQTECSEIVKSFDDSVSKIAEARNRLNAALMEKQESYSNETAFVNASNFADTLSDKLSKLELQSTILQDKMNELANSDSPDPTQWNTLEKQLLTVRLQYQAIEQQIIKNADAVELLGDKSKKTKGLLEKLWDKFKNVAFYRIVRTLLAQLTRGITAGLGNIAKFSEEANNILSSYKTEFTYIQNSLGAALLPILQSILPVVTRISDGLVDITNSIGMVSAALNGQSSFLKAKKYAQDYADTVEEVKKSTVGFDELNILGNNNQSQNDASQMFEKVDISGWDVAGAVAKITAITASLTALLMLIKGVKIGDAFTKMGKGIGTAYKYLKNATTWKKAGISIAALAAEAAVCYTSFYDLGSGTKTLGSTLLTVIPVCAAVGVAMSAMLSPVGWVITAVVGVTSAIAGFVKGSKEARNQKLSEIATAAFYDSATEVSVSLNDIASAYKNVWAEAETLGEQTESANKTISECATGIKKSTDIVNYYLQKLDETGTLSASETAEITNNVKSMVDNLETQMNTRAESIFTTFEGFASLCKKNFVSELGEMQTEFLAFQKLLGKTTSDYQKTIDDLLNESMQSGLSEEKRKELQDAVNSLSALNVDYGQEQYNFEMLLEKAQKNGVDFSNEEDTKNFLSDLGSTTKTYLDSMRTSYENSDANIVKYMKQNQILFDSGKITQADYESFNESFTDARAKLKNIYDEAVQGVNDDIETILNIIQTSALSKVKTTAEKASEDYANSSWWHKIWYTDFDDVWGAIKALKNNEIAGLVTSIQEFYQTIGQDTSGWLQQAADDLISNREWLYVTGYDNNGKAQQSYGYQAPGNGVLEKLLKSYDEVIKYYRSIDSSPIEGVWKSYQEAADAGYSNIRTRSEFGRGNNKDKQKYGTYEAYLKGMYKKYVLGLSTYATGGFPEDGLFFANHSELVGKFSNGKTAVANNEQIVEGIKRGVAEAMSEVGNSNGGSWVIQIVDTDGNVKGEKIITAAERKNRRDGKTVISIGG